jgi:hypothetical protein
MAKIKIDKQRRIIWTNNDYDKWEEDMLAEYPNEEEREEEGITIDYERYYEDCEIFLDDERGNLDKKVNGYIVAFADLGFWYGRRNNAKLVGDNVKDILDSSYGCDYNTFYCDQYNVKFEGSHHDGSHSILFRVAKDKDTAERLADKIAYHEMTEEAFRKATRSLRPYVAKVYGW